MRPSRPMPGSFRSICPLVTFWSRSGGATNSSNFWNSCGGRTLPIRLGRRRVSYSAIFNRLGVGRRDVRMPVPLAQQDRKEFDACGVGTTAIDCIRSALCGSGFERLAVARWIDSPGRRCAKLGPAWKLAGAAAGRKCPRCEMSRRSDSCRLRSPQAAMPHRFRTQRRQYPNTQITWIPGYQRFRIGNEVAVGAKPPESTQ
jgi:hypothetical protein